MIQDLKSSTKNEKAISMLTIFQHKTQDVADQTRMHDNDLVSVRNKVLQLEEHQDITDPYNANTRPN